MDSLILLLSCLIAGVLLRRVRSFPSASAAAFNQFVIYISLPALALFYIPGISIGVHLLYPLGVAWIGFALAYVFFSALARFYGWSRKLTGCLILLGGLGNTSFVGFPLIEALYGANGLQTAIIVDQPGSFMVMATLGIAVATSHSKGTPDSVAIAKKILSFPPFIAFAVAMGMNVLHLEFSAVLQSVFQKIGATVTPIALVAVGLQLNLDRRSRHFGFLALGLGFKLFVMPAFFYLWYKIALGQSGLPIDVSITEAAMAPMITASVLASHYGLKPRLANMMIGIGIPVSLATVAFWFWILRG